ncbi:hypothetical protein IWQ60_007259 [Tieghemiomyces parasiticus]|uniref:SCP domain-containing protein n=1 Tax=Tieghemiomyces parasiticus TaxID=78921 RepID=A0A9W8A282_9FUNG|nr:hypothetical protein IWQ60_007259 [Tieghemiomyces parasiticus]
MKFTALLAFFAVVASPVYTTECTNTVVVTQTRVVTQTVHVTQLSPQTPVYNVPTSTLTSKPSTPTTPPQQGSNLANQALILQLVNAERAKVGLKALTLHANLEKMAITQSKYQVSINKMTHNNPAGSLGTRATQAGVKWTTIAENVAYGYPDEKTVMAGWMSSTGHRENILCTKCNSMGAARVGIYWTQCFAQAS